MGCDLDTPARSERGLSNPQQSPLAKSVKSTVFEALLVGLAGLVLAFAANSLSPRGLSLTRNYFPAPKPTALTNSPLAVSAGSTNLATRLQSEGLQLATFNQVSNLFHDPGYQNGAVLFIDARNEQHFQAGHIPGAYLLDYYHPENHLGTILPLCSTAQEIVVYCNGGDCEDSQFTAMLLRDAQVPKEKLFVYGGGITEWTNRALPVELGERNSGNLRPGPKPANSP